MLAFCRASPTLCPQRLWHPVFSLLEAWTTNLCTRLQWLNELKPFPAMRSSWSMGSKRSRGLSMRWWSLAIPTFSRVLPKKTWSSIFFHCLRWAALDIPDQIYGHKSSGQKCCSICCQPPGQRISVWKCSIKNCELETSPRFLGYVKHDTRGQNLGPTVKNQLFHLSEICMVTHLPDCYGKDNLEKGLLGLGWENVPNWECPFVHRQQGLLLSVYVGAIKLAGRKQKPLFYVEEIDETRWSGRTDNVSWPRVLGMHSTSMQIERK